MKKIAVASLAFVFAFPAIAGDTEISAKKREAIRTVLELTGTVALASESVDKIFDAFSKTLPQVPAPVWQRLKGQTRSEELIERMIPIYDKYYTQQDLDGIIAFYRSPLGQKFIRTSPDVSREGFEAGQEWATEKGEVVLKQLRAEGLLPARLTQ
jgi:hypothetical protein